MLKLSRTEEFKKKKILGENDHDCFVSFLKTSHLSELEEFKEPITSVSLFLKVNWKPLRSDKYQDEGDEILAFIDMNI